MWHPLRRRRPRPRRLPRPAALGGRPRRRTASARDGAGRPWLDQPDDWARAHRRGPVRARDVDARPLPRRPAPAPHGPVARRRRAALASRRPTSVLAFARGDGFACIVNFGPDPVELPAGADVLIASDELEGGALPQDTTVWLRQANGQVPFGTRRSDRSTAMERSTKGKDDEVHPYGHDRRRHRGEPAGRVRSAISVRPPRASADAAKPVTISVASLIPGSTQGGHPAVQQPGQAVREGQSRRSRSSRSSTSGPARRSRPSSPPARCRRCSRCRSPTPARSATTASSPT